MNNDENTYKVTLEAETDEFKKQMKDVADTSKDIGSRIKDNLKLKYNDLKGALGGYSTILGTEAKKAFKNLKNTIKESYNIGPQTPVTTDYDKQITLLEGKINDLINNILKLRQASKDVDNKQQILEAEAELEKLNLRIKGLYDKRIDILDWDQTEVYIDSLYKKLEDLKAIRDDIINGKDYQGISLENVNQEIDRVNFQLKTAEDSMSEVDNKGKKIGKTFNNLSSSVRGVVNTIKNGFKNIGRSFDSVNKNIKRVALSMVGVHSAYYLISRAASSYQQYDIETTNKIKSAWAGLGAFLAPLLNYLADLVQKLVGYLNALVTSITGINFVKKANDAYKYSKSLKEVGKNATEATKSLTAMDEITNLQDNSGGGGSTDFNPFEPLQNMDLPEWLKDIDNIGEKLALRLNEIMDGIDWQSIRNKVVNGTKTIFQEINNFIYNFDWVKLGETVGQGFNTIIDFFYTAVTTFDWEAFGKKLGQYFQSLFDTIDWAKLGKTIGETIKGILESLDKFLQEVDWEKVGEDIKTMLTNIDWAGIADKLAHLIGSTLGAAVQVIIGLFGEFWSGQMDKVEKYGEEMGGDILGGLARAFFENSAEGWKWIWEHLCKPLIEGFCDIFGIHSPSTLMTEYGEDITDGLAIGLDGIWDKVKTKFTDFKKNVKKKVTEIGEAIGPALRSGLGNLGNNLWQPFRDALNSVIGLINSMISRINSKLRIRIPDTISKILKAVGVNVGSGYYQLFSIPSVPSLDVGTPYVEKDGLAMIHQGEAVVPKKFNSEEYFNKGNETTNALLVELIQAVEENSDKVPVFNINGKEFAKATYEDYRSEENRLNSNNIVRRA